MALKTLHILPVFQLPFQITQTLCHVMTPQNKRHENVKFKPNVIFIRLFLYKKHWITENKTKINMHLFTAWPETGKERSRGRRPVCILKTLIKHCALIYFDDIFYISQKRSSSALFHIEVKHRKKYTLQFLKPRLKTRSWGANFLQLWPKNPPKTASCWVVETDEGVGVELKRGVTVHSAGWFSLV